MKPNEKLFPIFHDLTAAKESYVVMCSDCLETIATGLSEEKAKELTAKHLHDVHHDKNYVYSFMKPAYFKQKDLPPGIVEEGLL